MLYRSMVIRSADIGGTKDRRANIFSGTLANYEAMGPAHSAEELIDFICADLPYDCNGVAISVAGIVENGVVLQSPNIPWLDGVDLRKLAESKCKVQTEVYNDMDGASAGMYDLLVAQGVKPKRSLCMTWSTGMNGRVVDDGIVANPGAEMGHMKIDITSCAPVCGRGKGGCGLQGCVESLIGGASVTDSVRCGQRHFLPADVHPCAYLDQQFDNKIPWALNFYDYTAKIMAQWLATVMQLIPFEDVIYKGTFGVNAFPRIGKLIKKYMKGYLMTTLRSHVDGMQFISSPDPENDALYGSAALFRKKNEIHIDV